MIYFSKFVLVPISKNLLDYFPSIPDLIWAADVEVSKHSGMLKITCDLVTLDWKPTCPLRFVFVSIEFDDFQNLLIYSALCTHDSIPVLLITCHPNNAIKLSVKPRTSNNFSFWIKICNRDVPGYKIQIHADRNGIHRLVKSCRNLQPKTQYNS